LYIRRMTQRLSLQTALLLTVPPLMWAGNAVVGSMVNAMVPPMMLNLLRWTIAFVLLLPLSAWVLRTDSSMWASWRRFSVLGLVSVGLYNALQYLALHTSSPINVTLVASSGPVWMLLVGRLFFGATIQPRQLAGAVLSIAGVLLVLSRGHPDALQNIRFVVGDAYILLAALVWAFYSWMLAEPGKEPANIRNDWAAFLMAQIAFGLVWSALLAGAEWSLTDARIQWGWPLAAALLFVAVGPALIAYRCWGAGIRRAGPAVAAFFSNLTPLFAALLSTVLLGDVPQAYHAIAFLLIVSGIVVSTQRKESPR
jgi:drug/metabolite transporter (DMT)-like permease